MSTSRYRLSLAGLVGVSLLSLQEATSVAGQQPHVFTVQVSALPNRDGFIDADSKARTDSANDLRAALRSDRRLKVIDSSQNETSEIEVIVGWRGTLPSGGSVAIAIPSGPNTLFAQVPGSYSTVLVALLVGDKTQMFWAEPSSTWRGAADSIARQIREWLTDNAAAVLAMLPGSERQDPRLRAEAQCAQVANAIAAANGTTLADKIRAVYPGAYQGIDNSRLEALFRMEYPCLKS